MGGYDCVENPACQTDGIRLSNFTCAALECDCSCDSGFFVNWLKLYPLGASPMCSNIQVPIIFLALGIQVIRALYQAKVTANFSVIEKAVAEAVGCLVVYFVGDPLLNLGFGVLYGNDLAWVKNAMAIVVV